jgi:hypothetical protein
LVQLQTISLFQLQMLSLVQLKTSRWFNFRHSH